MASENRRPEMRKDSVNNRWVIFSPARARRPSDYKSKSNPNPNSQSECAFCLGHEHECAPEIFRVPPDSSSGWKVRVIQNLYPALNREIEPSLVENPNPSHSSGDVAICGFGFHDVVIESPVHSVHLLDLEPGEVGDVLMAYKKRIDQLRYIDSIKYVQVFKNHGASAGASMSHSHSQIMALPVVPPAVSARLDSMKEYFDQTGKCSLCEDQSNDLLIASSTHFISIAVDLGGLLKLMLRKMSLQLNNPPFNFMIHSSPLHGTPSQLPYAHWFLQIVPQLNGIGGFEMGTGCYINPVFPEDAAKVMREVCISC
ncbi:ADP-glucose phosphorylase [Actinidia chinensis var. chinensis]|uniref:ADP-glucose phosphorylase n=1 Tax=Actinidia chinensis var. chinensis TaxID=1590841 RepID=A0A2R6R525_ACTCC|nr:ADP-glucose phosphorylase [Actinidia chinensis var. chinensis]